MEVDQGIRFHSSNLDFIQKDVLAKILVLKLKWSPVKTGVIVYIFSILLSIVIAAITDTLYFKDSAITGLFNDLFYWLSETILIPILWGYYVWVISAPYSVIEKLEGSGVIKKNEETFETAKSFLEKGNIGIASITFSFVIGIAYYFQHHQAVNLWLGASKPLLMLRILFVILPTGYVTWSFILRLIQNARLFKKLLKDVVLHPLHPDKAGGLRPLGRYALATTYIIAFGGSVTALGEYIWLKSADLPDAYFFHAALGLYLILAPLVFFAPLSGAHEAMRKAKDNLIQQLSKQFNKDYSKAYDEIENSAGTLKDNIEKIEQLQRLHKLTSEFPVWPFDFDTLRKFFITISSPIFTIIFSVIVDHLTGKLF